MRQMLGKLLNIRTQEWPRLLYLYVMFLLFMTGTFWAAVILEAAFLEQLGVEALPSFFIIKAAWSLLAILVYSAFADRIRNDKLLIGILLVSIVAISIGLSLLISEQYWIAYPLLFTIVFVPLDDIFFAHWYTYVNDFYDTRAAKRIVPILATTVAVSGIISGLTMPFLTQVLAPFHFIIMWIILLSSVAILAWLMPRFFKDTGRTKSGMFSVAAIAAAAPNTAENTDKQPPSELNNIREGYSYILNSKFLRWLALSVFLLMLLFSLLQYRASEIMLAELQTTAAIADFIGWLTGLTYLLLLPLQLFLLSRIINKIGLANSNFIFPSGILVFGTGLVFLPNLATAAMAFFSRTSFYGVIGYPMESLLYNAVPMRIKARARAFIGGLIVPIGALVGGLLLLLPITALVPVLILALAVGYFASAFFIRREYSRALIKMLEEEDYSFMLSQDAPKLTINDPTALQALRKKLQASTSHEFTVFLAKLISQIGGTDAVAILGEVARDTTDARSRAAILDVLVASDERSDAIRQLYLSFLEDPHADVRQSALTGLEQLNGPDSRTFQDIAVQMLNDPSIEVRAQILPALLSSRNPEHHQSAQNAINGFLDSDDVYQQARGVRILAYTGDPNHLNVFIKHLSSPNDAVRLEAAQAVEQLSTARLAPPAVESIVTAALPLLKDPIERVREVGVIVLGRLGGPENYRAIVGTLADSSQQVRATAADVLYKIGKSAVHIIHPLLNAADPKLRKMAAVILSRINKREFGPLIETHLTGNLLTIYTHHSLLAALTPCAVYPTITVINSALAEKNKMLLDEIFYLLSAVHNANTVTVVLDSLKARSSRMRANAVEALETLTSPQTARLIGPLFEPKLPSQELVRLSNQPWALPVPSTRNAIEDILTNSGERDHTYRALMVYALGEFGLAINPDDPPGNGGLLTGAHVKKLINTGHWRDSKKSAKLSKDTDLTPKKRRRAKVDPFAALSDDSDETKNRVDPDTPKHHNAATQKMNPTPLHPYTLTEIEAWLDKAVTDSVVEVRLAARAAKRMISGASVTDLVHEEDILLSAIEKIIFLKEVPFFQGMTVDQLRVLANVCEEEYFEEDARIFNQGDSGGALYVVVSGRVALEQEKRKGSFARLGTVEAHSYFGEMNLFDDSPRSSAAVAVQDTLTLRLRREPLIALARQYPDLSLELINVLSQRLREANSRIAELTRTRPRELHKLFDKFDDEG